MKKFILYAICIALLPDGARAQEKTLHDISRDTFLLIEAYADCAERQGECTAEELNTIRAGAQNSLRDVAGLFYPGSRPLRMLTADQVRELSFQARVARERLAHIQIADEPCNAGLHFFLQLYQNIVYLVMLLNPAILLLAALYMGFAQFLLWYIGLVGSTLWALLMTVVLSPTCLFWWL